MATINNSNEARSIIGAALGGKGNGNRQQSGDRPQAEFFINIGVTVPMPDENGIWWIHSCLCRMACRWIP